MKLLFLGLLVFAGILKGCLSVKFATFDVPGFALRGQPVWLHCGYDLEADELYSVKWYKDNVEFYRYLPNDTPAAQMYKLDGVYLDINQSNVTHARLNRSEMNTEGVYACEVSTEIPSFRTIKVEKQLYVYVIPDGDPTVFGVQNRYPIGSEVNVTCLYGPSKPAAELTWYINGEKAPTAYVRHKQIEVYQNDLKTSESRLVFVVDPSHLRQGALELQCTASVSLVKSRSSNALRATEAGAEFQHVLHVPPGLPRPEITGSNRYNIGNTVDLNCSSALSQEPAQLQWFVNDEEVKPEFLTHYRPTKYLDGLSSTKLGLHFQVQKEHYIGEEMILKCTATSTEVIKKKTVRTISVGPQRASGYQVSDRSASGWSHVSELPLEHLILFVCFFLNYLS